MIKNKLLLAAFVIGLSCNVSAVEPSFDKAEIGYMDYSFDSPFSISEKLTGYEVKLSHSLNDNWYVAGSYTSVSKDVSSFETVDLNVYDIGLGYRLPISENIFGFGELDYLGSDLSSNNFGGSTSDGRQAKLGIKAMFTDNLEFTLALENITDGGVSTNYTVIGGALNLNDNMAFYFDYKSESELNRSAIGFRFNF
ncbi:MAG: hypothetical protein Q9M92_03460 [Enterobacterales bacterium]|nr:hypothetical protein [Enterobacterales bacterium]